MKPSEMTRQELENFVRERCVLCKKKYPPFLPGEWYLVVDQDADYVSVEFDDRAHIFTYKELEETFEIEVGDET